MKVLRSTLLAGTAVVLAACGDKVTVTQPAAPTPVVNSVAVAPSSATLTVGQTITLTAAVSADVGATYTVAWTSSDATKASVGATTGVVTAVAATPGVAICAAAGGKVGCATIVVAAAAVPIPATVSIQSITINGNINAPVNPAAVLGVIDVRANVSPGNETVTKVVVLVGTTRADSQTFTAAQAAALRSAADEAIAAQSAFPPILFSINTAKFNATTGVPAWTNAAYQVSVQLYVSGVTTARSTATYQTPLTFVNANTYVLTTAFSGTTSTANSATGFSYRRGTMGLTALFVVYTAGITPAAGTITFGSLVCDAGAFGARTVALTVAGNTGTASIVFTPGSAAAVGDLDRYEFSAGACPGLLATGEGFTVAATDNNGNGFLAGAAPANAAANTFRIDTRPPDGGLLANGPRICANTNLRENSWINGTVSLTGSNTTCGLVGTSNNWMVNGTADAGVGGYTRMLRYAQPTAALLVDEARGASASATPTLAAPAVAPAGAPAGSAYCGIATATDALGNETSMPAAGSGCTQIPLNVNGGVVSASAAVLFNVDVAPPTITPSGGLASNARLSGGAVGAEFQVTVSDTGTVGNSGMLSNSAVVGTVQIRQPAAPTTCLVGVVSGGVCTPTSVNLAPAFPLVPTTVVAAAATVGYYFYSAVSVDAAGNSSSATPVTRVVAFDPAANVPSLTGALYNIPLSGGSVTFNANAQDNFDLRDIRYTLGYAGGLAGPLAYPTTIINAFPSASAGPAAVNFVNSNVPVPVTIAQFVRQIEDVTANGPITVSGAYKPNALNGFLRDQANNVPAVNPVVTAIAGASVTTGVSYLTLAAPLLPRSWAITNGATSVSTGATTPPTNALSVTLNADLFGPTATFNSPYSRVDFYVLIGGNLEQIGSATSYTTVDDGSAFGRRHRYQLTWTPGTTSPVTGTAWVLGAQALYAVGVNAAGDALVTLANGAITITNP